MSARARVIHIHLGPGALGLGLVAWAGSQVGFELHLVTRPDTKLPPEPTFELLLGGGGERERMTLDYATFSAASRVSDLQPVLLEALDHSPTYWSRRR